MESAAAQEAGIKEVEAELRERVLPLELFFDLVFVFAFTQVTAFIADDPTWEGLGRGLLILAALWWAWGGYAWLTGTINPDEGATRLAMFVVMAAMFVVALAVPEAFDQYALLFALSYLVVRWMHLVLYALASRRLGDKDLLGAIGNLAIGSTIGPILLVVAAAFDGTTQGVLWIFALAIDYGGPMVRGVAGWRLSPSHFAERFGLIVIVALGESIVAIGLGAAHHDIDAGLILAATLGLTISAALWWAYFDVVAVVAERKLREARGTAQNALARDSYGYLHFLLIGGIILFAVGGKKTIGDFDQPLKTIPGVALCGGVAMYLFGHIAMRYRSIRTFNKQRVIAAFACLALIPLALEVDAIYSMAAVASVCVGLIAYERIRLADRRAHIRASIATTLAVAGMLGAGCGGDDPVSAEELVSRGDELCRAAQERFAVIQDEPPASAADAASMTGELVDVSEDELSGFEDMTPPEELGDDYEAYLDSKRDGIDFLRDGQEAAERQDQRSYEELQQKNSNAAVEREKLARKVGFKDCGRAPGT